MVWEVGTTMKAAVLASDGRSLTTPRQLPFDGRGITATTAAYVGGAFYVVAPVEDSANPPLRMVRISTDGTVGTVVDVLPGANAKKLVLAAGAEDLRVVYRGPIAGGSTDTATYFQKITSNGASASDPVVLTTASDLDEAAGAFAFAADTVAVLSNLGAGRLDGIRIGGNGQIATPLFPMMSVPSGLAGHITEQNVARVGSDIVALWYTTSGIRLARVTP